MTGQQRDYGSSEDETTLVPGSLRVFRHFLIDMASGHIVPMSHSASMKYSDYVNPVYNPADSDDPYQAQCRRRIQLTGPILGTNHKSPALDCTCGFYAHYKQDEDFYPYSHWGRGGANATGAHESAPFVMVRAVCEVSGSVVMGGLGVRAEKIKIVAFAPDWDKYQSYERRGAYTDMWVADDGGVSFANKQPSSEEWEYVNTRLHSVAWRYGAKYYSEHLPMYEDHPEADISALGVTYGRRSRPEAEVWSQMQAQLYTQQLAVASGKAQQAAKEASESLLTLMKKLFPDIPIGQIVKASKKDGVVTATLGVQGQHADLVILDEVETAKERALRLKRQRPAPPGTGIDRRRGRLR